MIKYRYDTNRLNRWNKPTCYEVSDNKETHITWTISQDYQSNSYMHISIRSERSNGTTYVRGTYMKSYMKTRSKFY